ncbi:hypothetical protein JB92DRAFT_2830800 [Gautieria morchelliformis]|nr:hypothetical protein JB92DRAFT_2830800 [Gautieria morchelliformis]
MASVLVMSAVIVMGYDTSMLTTTQFSLSEIIALYPFTTNELHNISQLVKLWDMTVSAFSADHLHLIDKVGRLVAVSRPCVNKTLGPSMIYKPQSTLVRNELKREGTMQAFVVQAEEKLMIIVSLQDDITSMINGWAAEQQRIPVHETPPPEHSPLSTNPSPLLPPILLSPLLVILSSASATNSHISPVPRTPPATAGLKTAWASHSGCHLTTAVGQILHERFCKPAKV